MDRDQMTTNFIQLSSRDTVAKARQDLADKPGSVLAILDDNGNPFAVITPAEIENKERFNEFTLADLLGSNSSVMVTFPEVKLKNLVNSPGFIDNSAAMVFEQGELVGIVTKDAIRAYQNEQSGRTKGGSSFFSSDTRLAGVPKTPLLKVSGQERHYYNRHKTRNDSNQ